MLMINNAIPSVSGEERAEHKARARMDQSVDNGDHTDTNVTLMKTRKLWLLSRTDLKGHLFFSPSSILSVTNLGAVQVQADKKQRVSATPSAG